ncbi:MAG: GNAT family N-acetyltransferase [Burkholderiales bacterium]|nr:GNAT family N-acetyltransferase [Burkholderiales bacterium]
MSAWDFRPIQRADFALLGRWLAQPHVQRWWADDATPEGMESDYGGCVDGTEPAQVFIAWRNGRPAGLAQRLRWHDYPEYLQEMQGLYVVPAGALSIDYLIGEQSSTGRGWGTEMIAAFTQRLWGDHPSAPSVIVPVHEDNTASWRMLERMGFRRVAAGMLTPDNPADDDRHVVYRMDRPG